MRRLSTTAKPARVSTNSLQLAPFRPNWERVHIDYAGKFLGYVYLVVVDSHFKWLEVFYNCREDFGGHSLFARYGIPRQLESDNGPQFMTREFEKCMLVKTV